MGLDFELVDGQTSLDEEEKYNLRIPTITSRQELDEFEQLNIEKAIQWSIARKFKKDEILTESFVKLVHQKMFDNVWLWAGKFRNTNKNLGVDSSQIAVELRKLLDDCAYWIDYATYAPDEIAVRFKHRIVSVHCFPNGNGRHSRLLGDLIIEKIFGQPVFTWGANRDLTKTGDARQTYLAAVRAADRNDIMPLLAFARQ